ncbi:MAG: M14 family metallopeptidase, partial [Bacteroidota bacterium]|nr:M14 family metallopeptidase [Bacteroidota bacterium]
SKGTQTPSYSQIINWWKKLDAASAIVSMKAMDTTGAGFPLHLVLISNDKDFNISSIKKEKKSLLFINNGIHPGEPDGIDASMVLARDIVEGKYKLPNNIVLAVIPVYNIGGCLNRSENYRVDQNGPDAFGFRGNAQNLDLNRDFIKCDSKNAFGFAHIFHLLDPDIQIDNHVSNGADYQHVISLLSSQHNKLGGALGTYLNKTMEPAIYHLMKEKGYDLVPYVNHFGNNTPDVGWTEFWDSPRYSSGFATLWNTFSFMPETHMLKPYKQRVEADIALMKSFIEFASINSKMITQLREEAKKQMASQTQFPLHWKVDSTQPSQIVFKGYEAGKRTSSVSGLPVLFYDETKPFTKEIPFYNHFVPDVLINKPKAYIIPQGWWKVIDRLKANAVVMKRLVRDTTMVVDWYKIESFKSSAKPFEGHHLNSGVVTSVHTDSIPFRAGDYYIPLNGIANRFLIETLEPTAEDSYFTWNFFDAVLGQKEGFSNYVFEKTASDYLQSNSELKAALEERKKADTSFAKDAEAQLDFVFRHSPYMEPAYLRYPVFRVRE